ncbi:MAG: ECF-type sigma factor [Planctomycetota bacterium]|jgi:RNA polymerase sigma factor (TIGR02999 family)
MPTTAKTTRALSDLAEGGRSAAARLIDLVYDDLRALATRTMRQERRDHALEPDALVHEVYLRLIGQTRVEWKDRRQFFSAAARMMRRTLVDYARAAAATKRGGSLQKVGLTETAGASFADGIDALVLEEALHDLGRLNERHRRVVELRFFGGLSIEQTAKVLEVSPETVVTDWRTTRRWLQERLSPIG